jgi:hypothetical protein
MPREAIGSFQRWCRAAPPVQAHASVFAVGRRVYGACGGDRLGTVALTDDAGADALAPLVDVPGPNDDPKPDDEPDDETDDEPDEERDDEPDDEGDDEPEPGTLYFGENDGWTARSRCSPPPRPGRQAERAPWARRIGFLYDQINAP